MLKGDSEHKTQIVFSSSLPVEGSGILLHYNHLQVRVDGWETVDVREIVKENEEKWLSEIDHWHRSLLEKLKCITKWWPLFSVSRLIIWKTTDDFSLKSILFAASIAELVASEKHSVIRILDPSNELIEYVLEWGKNNDNLSISNKEKRHRKVTFNLFVNKLITCLASVKIILKMLWLKDFGKNRKIKSASIIVHSTVLDPDLIPKIGDHYFGHMIDEYNISSSKEIAWVYDDVLLNRLSADKELNKVGRTAYFISDLIEWKDLFFSIMAGYKSLFNTRKVLEHNADLHVGNLCSAIFPRVFISSLIFKRAPFIELMLYSQFKRIFDKSRADFVVYPYEEKPLEHAILMAASDCKRNIKTRAFAHAAYSHGHLYIRRKELGNPPYPDMIAVTGPIAKRYFIDLGIPSNEITIIGTPRYQEKQQDYYLQERPSLKILFITGLGFEMVLFSDLLINNVDLSENYEISIRRSFHSWKEEQDQAEYALKKEGITYKCVKDDLINEIDKVDVIVFESTSAAFQASLRGKIIVQMQLSDILPTDHFYGLNGPNEIVFCKDSDNLRENLDFFASLTSDQYKDYADRQRRQVEMLFSRGSQKSFVRLFSDINE
jgi:hypothetical protein